MKIKLVLSLFACIGVQSIQAAVSYVGFETGVGPTFTAQRWSNVLQLKTFNTAPSERYGTSGYYYLAPRPVGDPANTFAAVTGNDITQQGTLFSQPSALSANPSVINGTWVNFGDYAILDNPTATGNDRIGGISAVTAQVGGTYGQFDNFASLSVLAGQSFRFGVMVDALGAGGAFGARAVSIFDPTNNTVTYSSALTMDAVPELVFFDISNTSISTQTFQMALHQTPGDSQTTGFSLMTFDPVPEPSTYALLALGATVVALRFRRRKIA